MGIKFKRVVFVVLTVIAIVAGVITGVSRSRSGSGEQRKKEFDAWYANFVNYSPF